MILEPQALGAGQYGPVPERLRVSTWNVWFDKKHRDQRFPGLLGELQQWAPDLMAFQEVTMPFLRAVQSCDWLKENYWVSATEPNALGTLFVGRISIEKLWFSELPSDMGRRLLTCQVAPGFKIATCHLESSGRGRERRQQQLEQSFRYLSDAKQAVLMGDFNFPDGTPEAERIDSGYQDAWADSPQDYTMDSSLNPMLNRGPHAAPHQVRIDRLLYRGLSLGERSMLGTEALSEGVFCSDHFGLTAILERD